MWTVHVTFFMTVTLFIYVIAVMHEERKSKLRKRIAVFVEGQRDDEEEGPVVVKERSAAVRIVLLGLSLLKRFFRRRLPGSKEDRIELKLLKAGRPFNLSPVDFRMAQIAFIVLGPVLLGTYGLLLGFETPGIILFAVFGFALALVAPDQYLRQKAKARFKKALKELPDILDLLTVSLEAGLGFDAAIGKLVTKKNGVVAAELGRCLEEIRLGKSRREALSGIKNRLDFDEMRTFINSILQAEKLGMGMVQVMRVQSLEVREQRKQRAEEAAMKAPIKMLFPLVLFIFPCLFIVLLGPVAVQFLVQFK